MFYCKESTSIISIVNYAIELMQYAVFIYDTDGIPPDVMLSCQTLFAFNKMNWQ